MVTYLCHQVTKEQSHMALFYLPVQLMRKKNDKYFQGFLKSGENWFDLISTVNSR